MIKKEELLAILKDAYVSEESSVSIYTKHLKAAVFWAGIGKGDVDRVKELLERLMLDSVGHKQIVGDLIKKVEEADKDAF